MTSIRLHSHDLSAQILLEEQLSRGDDVAGYDGAVATDSPVRVRANVDVDGTVDVETGEDGLHLHDAVVIGWPHAAKKGAVAGVEIKGTSASGQVEFFEELFEGGVGRESLEGGIAASRVAYLYQYSLLTL